MEGIPRDLLQRVEDAVPRLRAIPDADAAHQPGPGRWSKKEILGHLIDSACNNHQRFVRAQLQEEELIFPGYEQEGWARCQQHASSDWRRLIDLWAAYNRHLAALLAVVSVADRKKPCRIGDNAAMTLAELAEDYLVHLDHHLTQLIG